MTASIWTGDSAVGISGRVALGRTRFNRHGRPYPPTLLTWAVRLTHAVPYLPPEWNAEAPGSRFTTRAALALLTRPGGAPVFAEGSDAGNASEVVREAVGNDTGGAELGMSNAIDGSWGRGADGWVPVVEWTLQAAVGGVIGAAAYDALKRAGRSLRDLLNGLHNRDVGVLVSRGAAALLAVDHVITAGGGDVPDVEFVEEPSAIAGDSALELNYVGAEPWIVSLVNLARTRRYLVVVGASGEIVASLEFDISEIEQLYLRLPPRD